MTSAPKANSEKTAPKSLEQPEYKDTVNLPQTDFSMMRLQLLLKKGILKLLFEFSWRIDVESI
ncbi:MAG: hypothetical protein ACK5L4_17845 [Pseudanabaena sp.]|jgi:hypothetical protein